jgi:hypothetical protein
MAMGAVAMLTLTLGTSTGWAGQEKVHQVIAAVGSNLNHIPSFLGVEKFS